MAKHGLNVVFLLLLGVLILLLVPAIGVNVNTNEVTSVTHFENETINLKDSYYATLTDLNLSNRNVTIQLFYNESSYDTHTKNVTFNSTETYIINSNAINVTNSDNLSRTAQFIKYNYSRYIGIPSGPQFIISNSVLIILFMMLIVFAALIASNMEIKDG